MMNLIRKVFSVFSSKQTETLACSIEKYFATRVYIDLDNMLSQLEPEVATDLKADLHNMIFELVAHYSGPVRIAIYGNLRYWGLSNHSWLHLGNEVELIDTPVENLRGKTITDETMIPHILRQANPKTTTVLVSSDLGFSPTLQDLQAHNIRTELVLFGHAHHKLKASATKVLSGYDLLPTHLLKPATCTRILASRLKNSQAEISLTSIAEVLKDYRGNRWQGYGSFKSFLKSLNYPGWDIDLQTNTLRKKQAISNKSGSPTNLTSKLEQLEVPTLSHEQFKLLFHVAATCEYRSLDAIEENIVIESLEQGIPVDCSQASSVLQKLLPQLRSVRRPKQLASAYQQYLYRKAAVRKISLALEERTQLCRLLWC